MSHHVERHVHLGCRHGPAGFLADVGLEGAEGQRVQEHAQCARLAVLGERLGHGCHHLGPAIGVGRIDVEEARAPPERLDLRDDRRHVGQGRAPVQVHAEDIQAGAGERARGGRAEAGGCAEDERPPVA
jgi:hypothetical protein